MDYDIHLPGGEVVTGSDPLVVVGPNGSGKTKRTREISAPVQVEFINALRNTRVAPDLPAMGIEQARANFEGQKNQTRANPAELASEFDFMLSRLLGQKSAAAIEFADAFRRDPQAPGTPVDTPLDRVEALWGEFFPGRTLQWRDWRPIVTNSAVPGSTVEYSGHGMSDGEKAALYLAGRVMGEASCVLVVDEPETHFHSLLAVRFWNALEDARPDIRFVYVTHDLTFALSRRKARYILASPISGLRVIAVNESLPADIAETLLGSASLSFYASRVVFCEGDAGSFDRQLYGAWFAGPDTVVESVSSCTRVMRCVEAFSSTGLTTSLTALGIVDSDFHPERFLAALPAGVVPLPVHEIESLLALPAVVEAVCAHLSKDFNRSAYIDQLLGTVTDDVRDLVVVNRWKTSVEPLLAGLAGPVNSKERTLQEIQSSLASVFEHREWPFSPIDLFAEEIERVNSARELSGDDESLVTFLRIFPGKALLALAARTAGQHLSDYANLISDHLGRYGSKATGLSIALEGALQPHLPARFAATLGI